MDKDLDHQIYNELVHSLPYRGNFLCQRKTLHTRILKLSVAEGKYSSIGIGKISLESGQFQKSLIQLKKALIINPDYSFAQVSLAEVCFKLEKENEAFSILNEVLLHDPGYTMAHQIIIGKLKEQDRFGDLDSFYQEIINRFSDDAKSVACLYCGSAQALTGLNERSKALKMYKKAREVDPNSGDTYQYAYVLYQEGEFEESRVQFEKLWQWNPTSGVFASNVAFMTYCMGRLQQAFEEFEELIANGLVSPGTYSNFILILYHMEKDEEVINRYRDILQQNYTGDGPMLRSMYEEAHRITWVILENDYIDEETREFNTKKIEAINFVLSLIN